MAYTRCIDCSAICKNTRCSQCRRIKDRRRNLTRPHYQGDYRTRRAAMLATATHCWLCGDALTGHPWPHPLSSTADHVHPGVADSPLRPAHLRCNASRGSRHA